MKVAVGRKFLYQKLYNEEIKQLFNSILSMLSSSISSLYYIYIYICIQEII